MNNEHMEKMREARKFKPRKRIKTEIYMDEKRKNYFKVIDEDAPSCKHVFIKAYKGSLRSAVNAMCLQCTHFDREYISSCTSTICPIWDVRPFQKKVKQI